MSWDVFVMDFPDSAKTVAEIPDNFSPKTSGSRKAIIDGILKAAPMANFSKPEWGMIDGPDFSIEINIGLEDPSSGFAFHIRGGNMAAYIIADILAELELRAVDSSTGEFFSPANAVDGLSKWRAYRNQVVK